MDKSISRSTSSTFNCLTLLWSQSNTTRTVVRCFFETVQNRIRGDALMKLKIPNKSFSSHCDYFSHKITFSFRRKQQHTLYYCCLFTQRYVEKQDDKCLDISRSTETILWPWNEFYSSYKLEYQVWKTSLNRVNKQGRCQLWLQAKISSLKYFT